MRATSARDGRNDLAKTLYSGSVEGDWLEGCFDLLLARLTNRLLSDGGCQNGTSGQFGKRNRAEGNLLR